MNKNVKKIALLGVVLTSFIVLHEVQSMELTEKNKELSFYQNNTLDILNKNKDSQSKKIQIKRKFDQVDESEKNNDSYVLTKKIRKNEEDIIVEEKASDDEIYVAQILSVDLGSPSKIEPPELTISNVTDIFLKDPDNDQNKQIELLKSLLKKPISLLGNKNRTYNGSKTSKKIDNIFTVTFESAGTIFEAPYEFLVTLLFSDDQELIDKTSETLQGYYTYNKEKNINRFKKRILIYALDRQSLSFTDELRKKILKFNNTFLDLSHDDKFKIFHTINGNMSKAKQKKDKLQSRIVKSSPTKKVSFYEFKVEPVIEIDLGSDTEEVIAINNNNVMPQFPVTQMTINNNLMPPFYVPQVEPDQSFKEKYSDPILWVSKYLGMINVKHPLLNGEFYLMTRFFKIHGEDRIRALTEGEVYQAMLWVQFLMPDLFRNQRG